MASRGVSVLKFVGTVSLGLLTGLSYTLSTLTVPTLLTLPSANTAAKAFHTLASTARRHLGFAASLSGAAFGLAFLLSPRPARHPYLLYTSLLVFTSRAVASDRFAPYLFTAPGPVRPSSTAASRPAADRKERSARARMEASYEVVGGTPSDSHSDGAASEDLERDDEAATASLNGEEVRGEVEYFLRRQVAQTAVAGAAFVMAIVGIWGDGAAQVFRSETFVVEL